LGHVNKIARIAKNRVIAEIEDLINMKIMAILAIPAILAIS